MKNAISQAGVIGPQKRNHAGSLDEKVGSGTFHRWSIEKVGAILPEGPLVKKTARTILQGAATLATGTINKRTTRSLAHVDESFSQILEQPCIMTEIGKDAESHGRILVMTIKPQEPGVTDSSIAIRKLTLEMGLSSALENFTRLISNIGGVMSDGETGLTISQVIGDYIHLETLRRDSVNGKKDAP